MAAQREEESTGPSTIDVSMQLHMLDCPICYQPLQPPILQCVVGHVICSSCHAKLKRPIKCCYCSCKKGYNRCHVLEDILESIQIPCSNAKYGCAVKTSYYRREVHERTCSYVPCFCPENGNGCSFVGGPARTLIGHLTADHKWPSVELHYGRAFSVHMRQGVYVVFSGDGDDDGRCFFFLLDVASEPFGLAVSVFCVRPLPHDDAKPKFRCSVALLACRMNNGDCYHSQYSAFHVPTTNLSDGMPMDHAHFIVPKMYAAEDRKIHVTICEISA